MSDDMPVIKDLNRLWRHLSNMMSHNKTTQGEFKQMILPLQQQLKIKSSLDSHQLGFTGPMTSSHFLFSKLRILTKDLILIIFSSSPNFKQDSNSAQSRVSKDKSKKSSSPPKTFNVDKIDKEVDSEHRLNRHLFNQARDDNHPYQHGGD